MSDDEFTCPRCGATSHHPMDADEGYCGACHDWTGASRWPTEVAGFRLARHLYFDRQGRPLTLRQWAGRCEDFAYKVVAQDHIIVGDEPLWVSTVWVGLDMAYDYREGHVPIIYETMVFGHGKEAERQERWATEAAALAGHDRILAELLDLARGTAPPSGGAVGGGGEGEG